MVAEMAPFFDRVIATRSRHPRSAPTAVLAGVFRSHGVTAEEKPGVGEALDYALSAAGRGDLICATGSLFVVAEAMEHQAKRAATTR